MRSARAYVGISCYDYKSPDVLRRYGRGPDDDFVDAVKGGRFITHNRKRRNVAPFDAMRPRERVGRG